MRHPFLPVLAAAAVALSAASAAGAHDPVVAPAKDKWLGEAWAQLYSLPIPVNPLEGNGDPCLTVGHKVIQAVHGGPCTVERGTSLTLGFGTAWSNVEDPFPETRREQLAAALAVDRELVAGMTVTVDRDDPVEIRTSRFELFSPQRSVLLPSDNILHAGGPQTVTLSAHGWGAVVRKLSLGEHEIVGETRFTDGDRFVVTHDITVVARGAGGG